MKREWEKEVLWESVVGSHLWGMNRPESDVDIFIGFVYPTEVFLRDYKPKLSYFIQENGVDYSWHEIVVVVEQLMKCNINFVIGVISDIVGKTSDVHEKLRNYVLDNPCKGVYHSIRGMAVHNYRKYVDSDIMTERKCNKILRVLQFGITLLESGRYEFKPYHNGDVGTIEKKITELDEAYKNSDLPEKMNEEELRDMLYEVRSLR